MDLADIAHHPQLLAKMGPPQRHADAVAALGERLHHITPQKTGAAEHDDEFARHFSNLFRGRYAGARPNCPCGVICLQRRNRTATFAAH
jgi:hypothetical protein